VSDSLKPLEPWKFGEANRMQLLIDSVIDYAIYMLDLEGRVVSWNSGAARLKGYAAEEIIGQPFNRFYTPEDLQAGLPEKALRTARETGRFHAEGWRVRKDGTRFWATVVIGSVHDEQGTLIGFAQVTRDITEQLAHQTLLESESRYRRLVEAVVDYAIFRLDASGHIATWNSGARRIKGYDQSEIIGKHLSTFYTEEDRKLGVPQEALGIASKTGNYEAEGWRVRKDGSKFWASVVIDAIRDDTGELVGFCQSHPRYNRKDGSAAQAKSCARKTPSVAQPTRRCVTTHGCGCADSVYRARNQTASRRNRDERERRPSVARPIGPQFNGGTNEPRADRKSGPPD
jgi:PAS domain S-box-containing protein